ncbi:MAG: hypothetical protein ACPGSC_07095 [Granulosicoccaceae bacterium]
MSKKSSMAKSQADNVSDFAEASAKRSDLQQIQSLLFGAQVREIEGSLQQLESRFNERLDLVVSQFEAQLQQLTAKLGDQLARETDARQVDQKSINDSVLALGASVERSMASVADAQSQQKQAFSLALRELKVGQEELLKQQGERLDRELQQSHRDLSQDKLSKRDLSELLEGLAAKL